LVYSLKFLGIAGQNFISRQWVAAAGLGISGQLTPSRGDFAHRVAELGISGYEIALEGIRNACSSRCRRSP
jgi:hypothetical protein